MRAPSTRTRQTLLRSGGPVAVLLAGLMVWQGSEATFVAETFDAGNNGQAVDGQLSNNRAGGAMFSVGNLTPGQWALHCIVVTSNGVTGVAKTCFENNVSDGLQNNITMQVQQGTGGSYATGFTPIATVSTVGRFGPGAIAYPAATLLGLLWPPLILVGMAGVAAY
jgi:hypothetical protein